MKRKLKIVVAGYAIGFPMGGQLWMMLHYLLGLARLGHDVLFIEDTSDWAFPFDPVKGCHHPDSSFGRANLEKLLGRYGLGGRWSYYSLFQDRRFGVSEPDVASYCASADLFLNISGVIPLKQEYLGAKVKAIVDTDPVFTQIKLGRDDWARDYYKAHDVFFTYGYNLPGGKTGVPTGDFQWNPLLPPIVLSEWANAAAPGSNYTTVGSWDSKGRDVVIDGQIYSWSKAQKYESIIDLPGRLANVGLELCFSGMKEDGPRYASHGWKVKDALVVSRDPWVYRDYIQTSRAEFTVAKEQNVRLKSGWFSDRAAAYLASGRPVIDEDTGFGEYLPLGEGLFAFKDAADVQEIITAVEQDYLRHAKAARRLAERFFDSGNVLGGMLEACGLL